MKRELAAGRARFARVIDKASGDALDEAVVTYFAAPHSYTAEDVVEIAAHGSPALMEYLVRECCAGGRAAGGGRGSLRSGRFCAGRIDLTQAEAVDDLIQSQTMEQARVAARQLGGALSRVVAPVKEKLVGLIAGLEAGIDFAEDDIDVMPAAEIAAQIAGMWGRWRCWRGALGMGGWCGMGSRWRLWGGRMRGSRRLFNRLVERERAIVTATPGTTRDLVTETGCAAGDSGGADRYGGAARECG